MTTDRRSVARTALDVLAFRESHLQPGELRSIVDAVLWGVPAADRIEAWDQILAARERLRYGGASKAGHARYRSALDRAADLLSQVTR